MKKKILIIGAGLAGLSCAYHLKHDYEQYEQEATAGGLCRTKVINGFSFDFAGHLLHFKTPYGFSLVNKLLGSNIVEHVRHSYIFLKNRFLPYPFQANTYRLPRAITKECMAGLIHNGKTNHTKPPENFYEWMVNKFGKGMVKYFMFPYNRKFWQCHPRSLTCEWLDGKIPVPSLGDSIAGAFVQSKKPWGYNARFWYPGKGGIAALPYAFQKHIKRISFNYRLRRIDLKKRRVEFSNGHSTTFDFLVLTIPLPQLVSIIQPLPRAIALALKSLNFLSIVNHNVGVAGRSLKQKNWVYLPEDKFTFYRIGSFSSFSYHAAPAGCSSLYIEVSRRKRARAMPNEFFINTIETELERLHLISRRKEIVARDTNYIHCGYIVYDRHYAHARKAVLNFLKKNNILSIGRFGSWRYLSMEESILDGKFVADRLNKRNSMFSTA